MTNLFPQSVPANRPSIPSTLPESGVRRLAVPLAPVVRATPVAVSRAVHEHVFAVTVLILGIAAASVAALGYLVG